MVIGKTLIGLFASLSFALPTWADSWSDSMRILEETDRTWHDICSQLGCGPDRAPQDPISDAYDQVTVDLLSSWLEGLNKRAAGLVPIEIVPQTVDEMRELLTHISGRWVGRTKWGTHIGLGEKEGYLVDLTIEPSGQTFIQKTVLPEINCTSVGKQSGTKRGATLFEKPETSGTCRGGHVGIRVYDDGTVAWTHFVGDWPQAQAVLVPIN